jgi:hypothetical protein
MSEEKREPASPHGIFEGSAALRQSVNGLIPPQSMTMIESRPPGFAYS